MIFDNEGSYDETQLRNGIKYESNKMKLQDVYDEVDTSTFSDGIISEPIPTRWVHHKQVYGVEERGREDRGRRCRLPSTPVFTTLRTLLALQLSRPNWTACRNISTCGHKGHPRPPEEL